MKICFVCESWACQPRQPEPEPKPAKTEALAETPANEPTGC
jgi:hypothetical protein